MQESQRFDLYCSFKNTLECENYLSTLEIKKFRVSFIRFRLGINELNGNNRFSSEKNEHCPFCMNEIENETHFLLKCTAYEDLREKYLKPYIEYVKFRNVAFLFDGQGYVKTRKVAMYIHYAFKVRRQRLDECQGDRNGVI